MRNKFLRPDHFSLKNLAENFPKMGLFWETHNFFLMEQSTTRDFQQFLIVRLFITDM